MEERQPETPQSVHSFRGLLYSSRGWRHSRESGCVTCLVRVWPRVQCFEQVLVVAAQGRRIDVYPLRQKVPRHLQSSHCRPHVELHPYYGRMHRSWGCRRISRKYYSIWPVNKRNWASRTASLGHSIYLSSVRQRRTVHASVYRRVSKFIRVTELACSD